MWHKLPIDWERAATDNHTRWVATRDKLMLSVKAHDKTKAEVARLRAVLQDICDEAKRNPDHPSLTYAIAVQGLRKC